LKNNRMLEVSIQKNEIRPLNFQRFLVSFFAAIAACTAIFPAHAQTVPAVQVVDQANAAQLLRQQERERELRAQQNQSVDVSLQSKAQASQDFLPKNETPCFQISHVTLTGQLANKFNFALKSVARGEDPAIGRCLGVQGINMVLARVQNAIIKKGYVTTRVVIAPQNLNNGNLELRIIPGLVHNIMLQPKVHSRRPQQALWNALPMRRGDLLNLRNIEQGLENLRRVPTADADIKINPVAGEAQVGESDLIVHYKQKFPVRVSVFADNGGSNTTGKYQGGVTLSFDNPLKLNDLLYISISNDLDSLGLGTNGAPGDPSEYGSNGYTFYYSVPYGYWSADLTASAYSYMQTIAGSAPSYVYSGDSNNIEANISRLIYRDAVRKTTLMFGGYLNNSKNYIDDVEVEVQRRRMAGWKAGILHREFIGRATLDLNAFYRWGTSDFNAIPAPEEAFGEGTARPKVFTGNATLNLPISLGKYSFRYISALKGQWAEDTLIAQDRFAIGGRYTVRGFDGVNILSGEKGFTVRNDLGFALGQTAQELYGAFDYGQVGGPSSEFLLGKELAGTAVGLRGDWKGFSYDVFTGWPVYKPQGFQTANTTVNFTVSWSS
jgi:hemolysin activation/secretion protein